MLSCPENTDLTIRVNKKMSSSNKYSGMHPAYATISGSGGVGDSTQKTSTCFRTRQTVKNVAVAHSKLLCFLCLIFITIFFAWLLFYSKEELIVMHFE